MSNLRIKPHISHYKYYFLLPLFIVWCLIFPMRQAMSLTQGSANAFDLDASTNEQISRYLSLIVNYSFGIDPNDENISFIPYAPPKITDLTNLNKNLNFIFSNSATVYSKINTPLNSYSSASFNPNNTQQPWWYDSNFDTPPIAKNPTIQALQNYFLDPVCHEPGCLTQAIIKQNLINHVILQNADLDQLNSQIIDTDSLSLSSLLNPLQYDRRSEENARKFIRYLTSGISFIELDEDSFDNVVTLADEGDQQAAEALAQYTLDLLNFAANSSVVNDNLNYLLATRVANPETNKSQVQSEYDMVASRIDETGAWRRELVNKSQNELLAEIAELLAQQQYQNFLRSRENERLIASMTSMIALQQRMMPPSLG